jgi:hypothetical protein
MSYITVAEFRERTVMPHSNVDALESQEPGFLAAQIASAEAWVNARLWKRYAVPFTSAPEIVKSWVAILVTPPAYAKLGWQPSSESDRESILVPAETARTEIKEAADSEAGLFELPLRAGSTAEGITRGTTLAHSEASPYTWQTDQRRRAGLE